MTTDLLAQLAALPDTWGLVAIDGSKRPYQQAWQHNPLTKEQAAAEIRSGRAKAIGALAGPASGGLLFVDHDGISATAELERLGLPIRSLPPTLCWTSGRDGRFQLAYHVPPEFWPSLRTRRVFRTGKLDADGKAENLDLRWSGHQSVIIGAHPQTTGYRWFRGRSPAEQPIATAPPELIELILDQPEPDPTPLLTTAPLPPPPAAGTVPLLDFISRDSRDLVESGGTPGSWNDDHLRLSLDLRGTEAWILAQGIRPDISARDAFAQHINAARSQARDFDESRAWRRFDGAERLNPQPSTPLEKLLQRLAFHTRTHRPALPPQQVPQPDHGAPGHPQPQPQAAPTTTAPPEAHPYAPALAKPQKLEAGELLAMLSHQASNGRIRFNTFSRLVEIDGATLEGSERFYLQLAEQGYKVAKELALDCLVEVANQHPYDPVRLYLEHVADTVEPTYIDSLATTYLRPDDHTPGGQPTLYDHMIRCTLIGAVRRVFDPGCKHDTACVLMGDQGARKSSFWAALGGPFFSDALGDINDKDDLMILHRSWIMEWAELDHIISRKQAGTVKAFLTRSTDLLRVPYGKAIEPFPRRGIIVGSTNRTTGFLVDDTGNRRFWVIPTTLTEQNPIDTPTLLTERDAIWAAAVHAYRNGEPSHLPPDLAEQVNAENQKHQVENPWRAPIEAWLQAPANAGKVVTTELILSEAIQKPIERQTRADQMQVGNILREVGMTKRRQLVDGSLRWVFSYLVSNL